MIIQDNIYSNLLENNAKKYNQLDIITGYSSPIFIQKVMTDFPNLSINIWIGMIQDGIKFEDHQMYQKLAHQKNVNIYYQIDDKKTHQKVYRFSNETSQISFVGSANFSEAGFVSKQREILISTVEDLTEIFDEMKKKSKICTDENINNVIPLKVETEEELKDPNKGGYITGLPNVELDDPNAISVVDKFSLIPQPNLWESSGINDNPGSLIIGMGTVLYDNIDVGKKIKLDINNKLYLASVEFTGTSQKKIKLENQDLYDVIANCLNISKKKPVSLDILKNIGCTAVYFLEYDVNEYQVRFLNTKN